MKQIKKRSPWILITLLSLLLVACSGGGQDPSPVVSEVQVDQLRYGQTSTFKLLGVNLKQDFQVSITQCVNLQVLPGGTDLEQHVSCRPNKVGTLEVTPKTMQGVAMLVQAFEIPNPQVKMSTNFGDLWIELNPDAAPVTVDNFLKYVNANFYNATVFHRLIPQFVIQGGWLNSEMFEKPGASGSIVLESNSGLKNTRGSIAMARGSNPNSAKTQFYFNLVDNPKLDYQNEGSPGYAVFGKIVNGLGVLDIMTQISTASLYGLDNVPTSNIRINSAVQIQ
jgi:cyclophilin family peptidyl-prolyl cis-trans isomerase